jgi:uncharacterized RDD family membrane protein YckC
METTTVYCNSCGFPSAEDASFCQRCGTTLSMPIAAAPLHAPMARPHYAGFWIRVVAAMFDYLLGFAAMFPVRILVGSAVTLMGTNSQMPSHEVFALGRIARISAAVLLSWAYRGGMESSVYQATLGKLAVGLKVTDVEGRRLSLAHATGRFFAKGLSTLSFGIGYVIVAFDSQKQGLHDRLAGTRVQYR